MSAIEYLQARAFNKTCRKADDKRHMCGICFWNGITMHPAEGVNHKCVRCKQDTDRFKQTTFSKTSKVVEFKTLCHNRCMWFEWFHNIRVRVCGRPIEYVDHVE